MKSAFESLSWGGACIGAACGNPKKRFPPFVVFADELALTFAECFQPTVAWYAGEWTIEQISTLRALDDKLATMSGPEHEALWLKADSAARPVMERSAKTRDRSPFGFGLCYGQAQRAKRSLACAVLFPPPGPFMFLSPY